MRDGDQPTAPAASEARRPRLAWWRRALPVSLMVGAAAAALLQLGGSSEQVELSTERARQDFVELVLTSAPDRACARPRAEVAFDVVSHLEQRRRLRARVVVDPAGPREPRVRSGKRFRIEPSQRRVVRTRFAVPSGGYDVVVRLAGRPERLRLHCGGGR